MGEGFAARQKKRRRGLKKKEGKEKKKEKILQSSCSVETMTEGEQLCSACDNAITETLYWQEGERVFCPLHKPVGKNAVAKLAVGKEAHTVRGELNVGSDAILKDLQNSRDEMNFA